MPKSAGETARRADRYVMVIGPDVLISMPLPPRGSLVIGRQPACDIQLADARVSRHHARLVVDRDVVIEDLGSMNGISIRGVTIGRGVAVTLALGECVRLGPYLLIALAGQPRRA